MKVRKVKDILLDGDLHEFTVFNLRDDNIKLGKIIEFEADYEYKIVKYTQTPNGNKVTFRLL